MPVTAEQISETLRGVATDISLKTPRRIFVNIPRTNLIKAVSILSSELNTQHLSAITAVDTGTVFEVLYHFLIDGIVVTLKTTCPKEDPTVESIVSLYPGAILYEREVHDVLGIVSNGHPDLRRLVLPEDWVGGYPLRKDWKPPEGEE